MAKMDDTVDAILDEQDNIGTTHPCWTQAQTSDITIIPTALGLRLGSKTAPCVSCITSFRQWVSLQGYLLPSGIIELFNKLQFIITASSLCI